MLRVGLTGGIASGKSTVAELFAELGAGIVDTDVIAREVVAPGEPGLEAVVEAFGPAILTARGELDRAALRRIVFRDTERRRALEAILHPLIRARTVRAIERLDAPYALVVVPLLLEAGFDALVDRILVVDCPEAVQRERLRRRDAADASATDAMLAAQLGREARLARADDVIDNGGSLAATRAQVATLHARYVDLTAPERLPK
jgi:dephospho-CoA kinase